MPKLGDAVGLSTIFQPLLPLPVHAHLETTRRSFFHLRDVSMVFSFFFCTEKTTTARVTEYSTRMQTRSVVAASVCDRVDPLLRRANAARTSARVQRVVENFNFHEQTRVEAVKGRSWQGVAS